MSAAAKPPIAPDVAEVIGDYAQKVDNRSLLLDKFLLHKSWPPVFLKTTRQTIKMDDASRWSFIRISQNGDYILQREIDSCERAVNGRNVTDENREKSLVKEEILRELRNCACRRIPGDLAKQKLMQNRQFAQALAGRSGFNAAVYGELQGRLAVNLSGSLIQNAGICLDRNTGLPFIPGSAMKGVARHAALAHLRSGRWNIHEFMCVFGASEADFRENGELRDFAGDVPEDRRTVKGGIDFLSAHPITEPVIVVDISNVHYPEYYASGNAGDLSKENPKPNTFPAVEKGVRYAFCIAANGMDGIDSALFAKARAVLIEAITVHGIGAKTGAGYGWFSDVTGEIEAEVKRETEIAEARRVQAEAKAKAEAERAKAKERAERMAALTPCERILERWRNSPNIKAIVNGNDIEKFDTLPDDEKRGIVEALRSPDIGAKVWATIKGASADDPRKRLCKPKAESSIRGYCRKTLKLGSMP